MENSARFVKLGEKWGTKYPVVVRSWENNWEKISTFFSYTEPIRRLIYTTNPIEGYHRQLRRVTKNKGAFTSEMAFLNLFFMAIMTYPLIAFKYSYQPFMKLSFTSQDAISFMGKIIFSLSVGITILPISAADDTKNDEIITLGHSGRREGYKATLQRVNGSNVYQIDGKPVYQANQSLGEPFFPINGVNGVNDARQNGTMSKFHNLNRIAFSFEDGGVRKINIREGAYSGDLKRDAENSYVGQLMPLLGADPGHVTNDALGAYINNDAVKRLDPLCGQGPFLANRLSDVRESNDFAFANKDLVDVVLGYNSDARIAHLIAEILKTTSLDQMATDFYSPSTQNRITSRRNTETILDKIFSIDGVSKITSVLGIAAIAMKLGDYLFKFAYTVLLDWWKRPTFIVYMSMPRNIFERIWFFIFGKPAKLEDTWQKIILHPVIKKQRDAWYKQLKLVIRYNKGLKRRDRVKGKGMAQNFLFVSGPPGTGKTMLIEALGAKAEKELGIHIIMFSGSEASKVSPDKIIPAMNEIYAMAERTYLSNGSVTLVLINEGDMFFGDRFSPKTSDATKAITAKFLDMMPEGAHRFLVFVIASNVDVRNEQEAKKYMDWAALDRFPERIIFNAIENDEEGWNILYQAFMLYLEETATTLSLKIDTGVSEYVKDRIFEFAVVHNTPRKMKAWSSSIVKNIAADLAEKKNKRKKITQDHLMEAFEAEKERKKIADRSRYQWSSTPVTAAK